MNCNAQWELKLKKPFFETAGWELRNPTLCREMQLSNNVFFGGNVRQNWTKTATFSPFLVKDGQAPLQTPLFLAPHCPFFETAGWELKLEKPFFETAGWELKLEKPFFETAGWELKLEKPFLETASWELKLESHLLLATKPSIPCNAQWELKLKKPFFETAGWELRTQGNAAVE